MQTSENIIEARATARRLRRISKENWGLAAYEVEFIADLIERLTDDAIKLDAITRAMVEDAAGREV